MPSMRRRESSCCPHWYTEDTYTHGGVTDSGGGEERVCVASVHPTELTVSEDVVQSADTEEWPLFT